MVMTHTQVKFSASPRPDIGVLLLELGRVGKLGKSGVSHGKSEGHVVHACVKCVWLRPLMWVRGQ